MLAPETVKLVVLDALPTVLLKAARVPVAVISGGGALAATENPTIPLELMVIVPS
jgi:hypothetical protein